MSGQISRRDWIIASAGAASLAALMPSRWAWSATYARTPAQTAGPFYPLVRSSNAGNDLVHVPGAEGAPAGELATVAGRLLDADGRPFAGALVEIWQANGYGRYNDERDSSSRPMDPRFKGYGTCVTDGDGGYRFQTIKPVSYPGRAPHIHFRLQGAGFEPLITQMYVAGASENGRDGVLRSLSPEERARLIVQMDKDGVAWRGTFDIVVARRAA
ncbi:MAG: protocatechuate 3,4-dioxygenase [Betaproteobacteria bacterium]